MKSIAAAIITACLITTTKASRLTQIIHSVPIGSCPEINQGEANEWTRYEPGKCRKLSEHICPNDHCVLAIQFAPMPFGGLPTKLKACVDFECEDCPREWPIEAEDGSQRCAQFDGQPYYWLG